MVQTLLSRTLAEGIGTFALTFIGAAVICTDAYSGGAAGLVGIALAHGLILAALVTALGHVSGAHVNPAVTLGAALSRAMEPSDAAAYVAAQIAGATVAGLMLTATFGADVWSPVSLGTPVLGPGVAAGTGIFLEAVLTFFLVLVVLQAAVHQRAPRHVYGFAIGATLTAGILAGGPLTGAALNPARALGPALASWTWTAHYVYWIGPAIGAVLAAVAYGLMRESVSIAHPVTREGDPAAVDAD